ncbi:hypothetical protein QJS10_CPA02g00996 [Acorus calamus]|uniref:Uncharacterized protein n=1 Tax=Acorus calamus TaxID=4465 RepID=A0AAV9FDQ9_ACOCL|nr:hypothetical protein QJS10_CPA02g00996 [Acorus calamus]
MCAFEKFWSKFKWDDVKVDKDRENYIGHSIMAPVGRWQKGKDLHWYARDKKSMSADMEAAKEEIKRIKEEEEQAMREALGLAPKRASRPQGSKLDKYEYSELVKRSSTAEDLGAGHAEAAHVSGLGFARPPRSWLDPSTLLDGPMKEAMPGGGLSEAAPPKPSPERTEEEAPEDKDRKKRKKHEEDEEHHHHHHERRKEKRRSRDSSDKQKSTRARKRGGTDMTLAPTEIGGVMNKQSLIYSFVARGTVVLAEHTSFSGNFTTIAIQCLQKLPSNSNKFTYSCDGHTFNFLVDNGFVFLVVADEAMGRSVPFVFLERVKDDFMQRYGANIKSADPHPLAEDDEDDLLFEDRFSIAYNLDREFGPRLKEHMQYCMSHPEEMSKLSKLKAQITEVKGIMMDNIEKVLDRGERIELLVDKTESLQFQADSFQRQGRQLRRKMWLQNLKLKLMIGGGVFALILILWLMVCKGFKC